jgi:hypothetical protein
MRLSIIVVLLLLLGAHCQSKNIQKAPSNKVAKSLKSGARAVAYKTISEEIEQLTQRDRTELEKIIRYILVTYPQTAPLVFASDFIEAGIFQLNKYIKTLEKEAQTGNQKARKQLRLIRKVYKY